MLWFWHGLRNKCLSFPRSSGVALACRRVGGMHQHIGRVQNGRNMAGRAAVIQNPFSAQSRNLRLTAVRSFFRYAALEAPAHAGTIQRVLAIPNQRQPRALVDFLTRPEIDALLAAPNPATWLGRRDHAFLLTAVQTGLRLSEMTSLRHEDTSIGTGAHVHCRGKGRKERCTPLTRPTVSALKAWMREQGRDGSKTLFPSVRGGRLSAVGVQHMVARHVLNLAPSS
jgi:integrase/recombinase XerD